MFCAQRGHIGTAGGSFACGKGDKRRNNCITKWPHWWVRLNPMIFITPFCELGLGKSTIADLPTNNTQPRQDITIYCGRRPKPYACRAMSPHTSKARAPGSPASGLGLGLSSCNMASKSILGADPRLYVVSPGPWSWGREPEAQARCPGPKAVAPGLWPKHPA